MTPTVWTGLSADALPIAEVHRFLSDDRAGGVCVFVGTTRRWTDGVETVALTYDAYSSMAEAELRRLADHAASQWPVLRIAVLHRTGVVQPTDPSVVVGVATPHRDAAFAACRWLIDTLKTEVPIWKRDARPDGSAAWVTPHAS